jgi:hypothetical protein
MGGVDLLTRACAAGLTVRADGDKLIVRGPRSAEALARELLEHKAEILIHLRRSEPASLPDYAATACVCPVPIGPTGSARCPVCQLQLICPGCHRCRGCKLILKFPPRRGYYG